MKDEDIEGALRQDAFVLFDHAVRNSLENDVKNLFWQFQVDGDSGILTSQIMSISEDMLKSFNEKHFSNNEISTLYKLRRSRSTSYRDAFQSFRRTRDFNELVHKLKEAIKDELASSSV